jgi:hypothetical protein
MKFCGKRQRLKTYKKIVLSLKITTFNVWLVSYVVRTYLLHINLKIIRLSILDKFFPLYIVFICDHTESSSSNTGVPYLQISEV